MDELRKLLEKYKDDKDTVDLLNSIKSNNETLLQKVSDESAKLADAISTRDKAKNENSKIKTLLGLEEITEEAIKEKLASGNKDVDELKAQYEAQLADLSTKIADKEKSFKEKESEYEQKFNRLILDNEAKSAISGLKGLVQDEILLDSFSRYLMEDVAVIDGVVIPQHLHNNQKVNMLNDKGQPLTLREKAEAMLSDERFASFVAPTVKDGGGDAGGGGVKTPTDKPFSEMTLEEKSAYVETV